MKRKRVEIRFKRIPEFLATGTNVDPRLLAGVETILVVEGDEVPEVPTVEWATEWVVKNHRLWKTNGKWVLGEVWLPGPNKGGRPRKRRVEE